MNAQETIERAIRRAVTNENRYVTPWHCVAGALDRKDAATAELLAGNGVDLKKLNIKVDSELLGMPKADKDGQQPPISRELEKVLIDADDIASNTDAKYIGSNHVLLALLTCDDIAKAFEEEGAKLPSLRAALESGAAMAGSSATTVDVGEYLGKFTIDLTDRARKGELDPVIGRSDEVRKVIQVLCRRRKNNPLLIGEPGVGKTAIIEGLAQKIANGEVPDDLKLATIRSLDMGQLVAGTKLRGEFEERFKRLLDEVQASPNIILFIDEIHLLVGAGKTDGAMDASNLIKPALARGELRCLGATTLKEYREYIEKDQALTRRFQTVNAEEPSEEEALSILRGIKQKYELHHGVQILDAALQAAVKMSRRYICERFLPDKAIDLMDETAAAVRLDLASKPEEIAALDSRLIELEIEINALEGETIASSEERLAALKEEREDLTAKCEELTAVWEKGKQASQKVQEARTELDAAKREMEQKVRDEDFSRVAELQYKVIPKYEAILAEYEGIEISEEDEEAGEAVTEEHIAETISQWTGIPVSRMMSSEKERLANLEDHLRNRVIGQDEALTTIAKAVRRSRAGLQDPNRPIASFLMPGPTGVGKTELAKSLAEFMFDDEGAMIRLDMSEFMEKHTVARLVGAPPGYVGYEEGGLLTNKVKRKPYSVVLFDEVEKAHPDVFNLLLQLLDDGRLTDSSGVTVNFANTIVLLTSNLGAEFIRPVETDEERAAMYSALMDRVNEHFRPEFINRLDDVIVFNQLTRDAMLPILEIQLRRLQKLLDDKEITLRLNDVAKDYLAAAGYNPLYGARPLKRVIQSRLQDLLADGLISSTIEENSEVFVSVDDGKLVITDEETWNNPPEPEIVEEADEEPVDALSDGGDELIQGAVGRLMGMLEESEEGDEGQSVEQE